MSARLIPAATVAILLGLLTSAGFAQDKAAQKFLTEAIQGNFAETQMGELAQKNGQSEETKSYGKCWLQIIRTPTTRR
jgi:putative membrane protein